MDWELAAGGAGFWLPEVGAKAFLGLAFMVPGGCDVPGRVLRGKSVCPWPEDRRFACDSHGTQSEDRNWELQMDVVPAETSLL